MDENPPPPPPFSNPEPKPAEPVPPVVASEGTGLAPNIAATICAALPLVGGIIFLGLEKKNAFVRFWAMQSVFFGGAVIGFSIVSQIASFVLANIPFLGWLVLLLLWILGMIVGVVALVIWIVMMIKAFSGAEWEIPFLGRLARKQLAGQRLV